MPHLKVLNLSFNPNIGPGGAVPLIRSLGALNLLEELDFNKTAIGVEDCRALSELKKNFHKFHISMVIGESFICENQPRIGFGHHNILGHPTWLGAYLPNTVLMMAFFASYKCPDLKPLTPRVEHIVNP